MTIKEMEEVTGMSRTNIRFYEAEGLIHPQRRENGYREYAPGDAKTLMKVKLLRGMDVPLEQVKAAAFGERRLKEVLDTLEKDMDRQQAHRDRARQTLEQIRKTDVEFDNLEPEGYLAMLEDGPAVEDAPTRLNLPWRRYWARGLDFTIYGVIVEWILEFFPRWGGLHGLFAIGLGLLVEPLLLSLFSTTPGKAIFGLRVTDPDGGKLDYGRALVRTWTVLWEGQAMGIPLVSWYFQYKSLRAAEDEQTLPWEWESELTFRDDQIWRYVVFVAVYIAMEAMRIWMAM